MYDYTVALRRFQGLIKWIARKYAVLGNYKLSQQDLEGEGYLVLVRCCRSFPETEIRFSRYFKTALYNHLKHLIRDELRQKRTGVSVDLVEAFGMPDVNPDFREYLDEVLEGISPYLSDMSKQFLRQLAEPSLEVFEEAWQDFCRKNKLHSQGIPTHGYKKFRVKPRHIRKVFGWTAADCRKALKDIRSAYQRYKLTWRIS